MNIAIVKIGARISCKPNDKNGNSGEIRTIVSLFTYMNASITLISRKLKGDEPKEKFNYDDIKQIDLLENYKNINELGLDTLVIIGGSLNFFGGMDGGNTCELYKMINTFKGRVLFFYTDPVLLFKQLWSDQFYKRNEKWGTNWTENDLLVSRNDIICISADTNIEKLEKTLTKPAYVKFADIKVLEWQKLTLFEVPEKVNTLIQTETYTTNPSKKNIDLVYGGFIRGGARDKQFIKYFFNTEYSTRLFGGIKPKHFEKYKGLNKSPEFIEKSGGWEFFKSETNKSYATIIFAEESYCDSIVTMRVYASVLANTVVFIEDKYDSKHSIFPNLKFNYITSARDLAAKIDYIKEWDEKTYTSYCKKQLAEFKFTVEDIHKEFKNICT